MNQLISDGGDRRTAPATPGLLNILFNAILFCVNIFFFYVPKAKPPMTVLDIFHQSTRRHVQRCAKTIHLKLHNVQQIAHYTLGT